MAKSRPALAARAAADRYVEQIARRVNERWPDVAERLAAAYGTDLDATIGHTEAVLAAAGVGMREVRGRVPSDVERRLRTAVASSLASQVAVEAAGEIGGNYEALWESTGDPRALGIGFIMRVLGDDPGDAGGGRPLIHFTVEKILGGSLVEAALGVWSAILSEYDIAAGP